MVQTRHQLNANESIQEEPIEPGSNYSNKSHNGSHLGWIDKAFKKVENATSSVAHKVAEVSGEAWNSTKGLAEKLWDRNKSEPSHTDVRESKSCVTQKTSSAQAWFVKAAAAGSPCLFGVDDEDEGYHCIDQGGSFGPNGWCWTKKDKSEWGRCSDNCPLTGPQKVLARKLEQIQGKLEDITKTLKKESEEHDSKK